MIVWAPSEVLWVKFGGDGVSEHAAWRQRARGVQEGTRVGVWRRFEGLLGVESTWPPNAVESRRLGHQM